MTINLKILIPRLSAVLCLVVWLMSLFCIPCVAAAAIRFEDVSEKSGILHSFSTAASAWGDFNGDGWPDLWVSNHWHQSPSLYLNQQNGTFVDIAADTVVADLPADFHGAAWADFDNDGDQDLIVTTGGGAGEGTCPNYLLVNQGKQLLDKAIQFKLDYPLGRGRTPLWFDADGDGKLDLLIMNRVRPGGKAPSAIFLQTGDEFIASNEKLKFNPSGHRTKRERLNDLFSNLSHLKFRLGAGAIMPAEVFPQLADLTGDHHLDLITFVKPMRVYSIATVPFQEITNDIGFPDLTTVQDAAIEDFDGDNRMDMFLVRSTPGRGVAQVGPLKLQGKLKLIGAEVGEVQFRSKGTVTFTLLTLWIDPSAPQPSLPWVAVGGRQPTPIDGKPIILDPHDPALQKEVDLETFDGLSIQHDAAQGVWTLRSALSIINFTITSTQPIDQLETVGFNASLGEREDFLLLNGPDGFRTSPESGLSDRASTCISVTAGDFDNDMDMDLYLVCSGPAHNLPNILFENDGKGHFTEIPGAGGAAGSVDGIGNQVVSADYDRDGFLDLFLTNGAGQPPYSYEGPHQLFRNKGNKNHWLEIDLHGTMSNRDAIGSVIELQAGGVTQVRNQGGGIHSFSQNHQRIHFGLGKNTHAEHIAIRWPSGAVTELEKIAADQILQVKEQ